MKKIASALLVFLLFPMLLLCSCDKTDSDIFFMVDGEIYASYLEDGFPADPVKEGYVFAGWYLDEGTWNEPLIVDGITDIQNNNHVIQIQPGASNIITSTDENGKFIIQGLQTDENGSYVYNGVDVDLENSKIYSYVVGGDDVVAGELYITSTTETDLGLTESIYVYARFVKATEK